MNSLLRAFMCAVALIVIVFAVITFSFWMITTFDLVGIVIVLALMVIFTTICFYEVSR